MRASFIRLSACVVVIGVGSLSLSACSEDAARESSTPASTAAETGAASGGEVEAGAARVPVHSSESAESATVETVAKVDLTKVVSTPNIFYTAVGAGSFLKLANLLVAADLLETVKDGGPFTVFAPTDDAFAGVPADMLRAVAADKAKLQKVLLYHVVPGNLKLTDLTVGDLTTAEGAPLKITKIGERFYVNGNPIVGPDVVASNGVIHVMGSVLLPPDL